MRRGQALKFQRDFKLAVADFEEARKLQKEGETDADKWIRNTQADVTHYEKIAKIMENSQSLAGKEYIDYLLAFLKGKKDEMPAPESKRKNQVCLHELTAEEFKKLEKTLTAPKSENMVYYFQVNGGLAVLVDSLYFSTLALPLIETLL